MKEGETIIDEWRSGHSTNLIEIKNKMPTYDEGYFISNLFFFYKTNSLNLENKTYTLNLHENRVIQPSHKNFQLITSGTFVVFFLSNKIFCYNFL